MNGRSGGPNAGTDGAAFTLGAYTEGIREGWPESDIERWIVCGLPRDFNVLNAAQQRAALAERVPLTHTRWDALLAATSGRHGWTSRNGSSTAPGFCRRYRSSGCSP